MLGDDFRRQAVVQPEVFQLDQEALAQVPRRNSNRVKKLDTLQYGFEVIRGAFRSTADFVTAQSQVTVFIEVLDDMQADRRLALGDLGQAQLPDEMILEGGFFCQTVFPRRRWIAVLGSRLRRQWPVNGIGVGIKVLLPIQGADLVNGGKLAIEHRFGRFHTRNALRNFRSRLLAAVALFGLPFLQGGILLQLF